EGLDDQLGLKQPLLILELFVVPHLLPVREKQRYDPSATPRANQAFDDDVRLLRAWISRGKASRLQRNLEHALHLMAFPDPLRLLRLLVDRRLALRTLVSSPTRRNADSLGCFGYGEGEPH